jgi:hypothetical protein
MGAYGVVCVCGARAQTHTHTNRRSNLLAVTKESGGDSVDELITKSMGDFNAGTKFSTKKKYPLQRLYMFPLYRG